MDLTLKLEKPRCVRDTS